MLLTIPNSALDSLCPTTEQFESTQVEVSLDRRASQHSIMVLSHESAVESVVNVPSGLKRQYGKWPSPKILSSSKKQLSPRRHQHDSRQDDAIHTSRRADLERDRSPVPRDRPTSRRLPVTTRRTVLLPVVRTSRAAQKVLDDGSLCLLKQPKSQHDKTRTNHQTLAKPSTTSFDWGKTLGHKSFSVKPNLVQTSLFAAALSLKKNSKKVAPVAI